MIKKCAATLEIGVDYALHCDRTVHVLVTKKDEFVGVHRQVIRDNVVYWSPVVDEFKKHHG